MTTVLKLADLGGLDSESDFKGRRASAFRLELALGLSRLCTSGEQILESICVARLRVLELLLDVGLLCLDGSKGESVRRDDAGTLRCVLGGLSGEIGLKTGGYATLGLELTVEHDVVLLLVAKLAPKRGVDSRSNSKSDHGAA